MLLPPPPQNVRVPKVTGHLMGPCSSQHILTRGSRQSDREGKAPSPALAGSASTGSWDGPGLQSRLQRAGAQVGGHVWGHLATTVCFPWNDLVPLPAGGSPISLPVLGSTLSPSASGRFGTAGSVALILGPGWHGFSVKLGGMCPRRPSTQVVRPYLMSGGCHVTTENLSPPTPAALMDSSPCKLNWPESGSMKILCAGPDTGEEPDTRPGLQA